ncbi:MAG: polysaccharide lyase family protein, partial [Candidatus Pacebacteria bacterium]|nr:polysaccharide lyase family protein [Candidatus Paceibacterota bacterium]
MMKKGFILGTIIGLIAISHGFGKNKGSEVIWQIGINNNSATEFALAPGDYKEFLNHDFGWEDRFYLVGKSNPKNDFPYILPGPDDRWGGTSGTAGIRTHVLNVLFSMKSVPETGDWKLIIDMLDTNKDRPPYFKVTVNSKSWKYILPSGGGDESLTGNYDRIRRHTIQIPLDAGLIKKGGNKINFTNLEGSWLIFDDIRLEGPGNAKVDDEIGQAYLRGVKVA